jgi:hypothetical protein
MAKKDFFTFGDEDVGQPAALGFDADGGGAVAMLAGVQEAPEREAVEAAEGAQRSRGDSKTRSSEKREPPSLRVQGAVVLALLLAAIVLFRIVLGAAGGDKEPQTSSPSISAEPQPRVIASSEPAGRHVAASPERAAQRERAQLRREQTRPRARRSRGPRAQKKSSQSRRDGPSTTQISSAPGSTSMESDSMGSTESAASEPPATSVSRSTSSSPPEEASPPPPTPQDEAQAQFGVESASGGQAGLGG